MASRGNNDVYEIMDKFKNNFVFSETLSGRLKCFICQKVLVNAKQTSCGCKGCDKCFISLLKDGPQNCPSKHADCKDVVIDSDSLSKDNATNKDIRALEVECPNEGCKKIIEIKELPNHFNECQYRLVKCDKCDKDYQFNLKNVHVSDVCSKRNFKCEWCNKLIVYDDYENDHLNFDSENLCSEYIDNCPNECKVMGKVKIKEHLRNCDEFKVKCPYHSLWCSEKAGMSKTRLVVHLNEKGNEHIEKFIVEFNSLKENVSDYKKEAEHLTNLLNESKEIDKKLSVTIDKIHEENKKLEAQSNSPSLSLATNNRSDGNKVVVFRNGAFIWKIDEYHAKRLDAENGGRISWTSDPVYTSQFGFRELLKDGPTKCHSKKPYCKDYVVDNNSLWKDNAVNKEILALNVQCPNNGCAKKMKIKELPSHFNECQYILIQCDKCGNEIQFNKKELHLKSECLKRILKCDVCYQELPFDTYANDHFNFDSDNLCNKYVDYCPNKCEVREKIKIKEHLLTCDKKKMKCPYHKLDCSSVKMSKLDLEVHLFQEGNAHQENFINRFLTLKEAASNIENEFKDLQSLLAEYTKMDIKMNEAFAKIHDENKKLVAQLKSPPLAINNSRSVNNNVVIFRNGVFIWKIDQYQSKKENAENGHTLSWTSDPFYTSQFGYKLCLRIYPAGHGIGKGSHLSVFFVLMKGEYDNLLTWPFQHKIYLSILDQSGRGKHYIDMCQPNPESLCYQKPLNEYNVGSGSPQFISISNLTESIGTYLKNDTLFLQILIDSKNICTP